MHNFIYGTADVPFDDEPPPTTANGVFDKGARDQPALNWPGACAEIVRAFITARWGGPPVLKPADDDEPLPLPGWRD